MPDASRTSPRWVGALLGACLALSPARAASAELPLFPASTLTEAERAAVMAANPNPESPADPATEGDLREARVARADFDLDGREDVLLLLDRHCGSLRCGGKLFIANGAGLRPRGDVIATVLGDAVMVGEELAFADHPFINWREIAAPLAPPRVVKFRPGEEMPERQWAMLKRWASSGGNVDYLDDDARERAYWAEVDLNGDGRDEMAVYLSFACGTAGCTAELFVAAGDDWRFLQELTLYDDDGLRISGEIRQGWLSIDSPPYYWIHNREWENAPYRFFEWPPLREN